MNQLTQKLATTRNLREWSLHTTINKGRGSHMDMILQLLSSIGAIKDVGTALINERDSHKFAAIQIDLSNKIIEAQAKVSEVMSSIVEKDGLIKTLTERNRDLESEQLERARYELAKLGVDRDFFAYRLRPAAELSERKDEPTHFLCQPCFDVRKQKSILVAHEFAATCNACGVTNTIKSRPRSSIGTSNGGGWMSR